MSEKTADTEQPLLGFVRDNPFVKNDVSRRVFRRSATPTVPQPSQPVAVIKSASQTNNVTPASALFGKFLKPLTSSLKDGEQKRMDEQDRLSIGSGSDFEYGPGIVEKLKAKFHRLSGIVTREAKVSPHTTGKRCPSMDDILAGNKPNDEEPVHPFSPRALLSPTKDDAISPLSRKHSKSTSDVYGEEESRSFTVHRTARLEKEEIDASSISALRRKFEANVQRRPSQNMRYAKEEESRYRLRPVPIDIDLSSRPKSDSITLPIEDEQSSRVIRREHFDIPIQQPPSAPHSQPPTQPQAFSQTSLRRVAMIPDEHITNSAAPDSALIYSNMPSATDTRSVSAHSAQPPQPQHISIPAAAAAYPQSQPSAAPPLKVFEVRRNRASSIEAIPIRPANEILNRNITSEQEEPEFVKIGRRLKRSEPVSARERSSSLGRTEESTYTAAKSYKSPTEEIKRLLIPRKNVELPTLSSNARIIRQEPDLTSPPDPDSARLRSPAPIVPVTDTLTVEPPKPSASDYSPPPEEPKPPQDLAPPSSYFINRPTGLPPLANNAAFDIQSNAKMTNGTSQYSKIVHTENCVPETAEPLVFSPNLTPKILPKINDESGRSEMYTLLDRFQKTRPRDELEDLEKKPMETRRFVPTVVSFRQTPEYQPYHAQAQSAPPAPPPHNTAQTIPYSESTARVPMNSTPQTRPNVVSISVRPQGALLYSNVGRNESGDNSLTSRTAPSTTNGSTDTSRKSLSAQFIEQNSSSDLRSNALQNSSMNPPNYGRGKPYGDDVTEIRSSMSSKSPNPQQPLRETSIDENMTSSLSLITRPTFPSNSLLNFSASSSNSSATASRSAIIQDSEAASSSTSSSDDEDIVTTSSGDRQGISKFYFNNQNPMIAGDGNLVRHSLMSLVAEEDIPSLLEAMNEQFSCTFVDLNQKPSTSSIIHEEEKRKERRRKRQVSRIRFETAAPEVYTYLDEVSAINSQQWPQGTMLDYSGYQKLLAAEQEEYEAKLTELEKWKASLAKPTEETNSVDNNVQGYNRWGTLDRQENSNSAPAAVY